MPKTRSILLALLCLVTAAPLHAQGDPNNPTIAPLSFGTEVEDIITEAAFFDWWIVRLDEGDTVTVTMSGQEGLAPLVGLLAPGSELVQRSEDGDPNGTVTFSYTAQQPGEYRIVATRTGNQDGDTVGRYTLTATLAAPPPPPQAPDPYREVTFQCQEQDVPNVLTLELEDDKDQTTEMSVSVYGLDGFEPGLRTTLEFDFDPFFDQFCITGEGDGPGVGRGDRLQLPGMDEITFENGVAKTNFRSLNEFGIVQLNVAALNDTTGRYIVVIDGFTTGRNGDRDLLEIGLGPRARDESVRVYAVSDKTSRLDSAVQRIDEGTDVLWTCDDAGVRDCADVPPIDGFAWYSAEFDTTAEGGRFDGGIVLSPGTPDKQRVLFGGFGGRTYGDYTIVIIGEFTPDD